MPKGIYIHTPHNGTFKKGDVPWTKGKKLSQKHKEKISFSHVGIKHTEESRNKMSLSQKLRFQKSSIWNKGKKMSKEVIENNRKAQVGKKASDETKNKMSLLRLGEKNVNWIKDRTKLKKSDRKKEDVQYMYWAREVKNRDNWKCKMFDKDCNGRLESHHIFNWVDYPELRYDLNNGITLCKFHHPRKWEEEKRLSLYFKSLIS